LKQEVQGKQKSITELQSENEDLVNRVATAESTIEQKDEEITTLTNRKMEYRFIIEQEKDKNKMMNEVLDKSE
jgi:hypothetical protein